MNVPRLAATLYTDELSEQYMRHARTVGYRRDGKTWAVVHVGGVSLTATDDEGLAGMQRLVDALASALAQARQAEQDEALAENREPEQVPA